MTLRPLFALAWRESRTARRRLLLYMSSIALGVGALVAIDSFADNVSRAVREQSRTLLGGDVVLSAHEPLPARATALLDSARAAGMRESRSTTFASMAVVTRTGATRLVQVRAVSPGYPLYGEITTSPASAWQMVHRGHDVVVDPSLLVSLDAQVGDTLNLGTASFVIRGTIESVPGDVGISATIGPRVYVAEQYVPETGLLVFGSRADYEAQLALPDREDAARFAARHRAPLRVARVSVRTAAENEFDLTRAIEQLSAFLGVIGLVALLLGGIGVASGVHAFVMRKIDTVAILRCVGATSWQVMIIYVVQAAAMGLIGALVGAALGVALQLTLPHVIGDFLPVNVAVHLSPRALALGLLIGTWVALVFALRPLVALRRVSPLQALRRESDADALRPSRGDPARTLVAATIAGSVILLGMSRSENPVRGIAFSIAIGIAVAFLWLAAALLTWAARRVVRPSWPFVARQGIAALYRPGNQTRSVVLALGFGVFLVSTVYQVQHSLLASIGLKLEQARANLVLFDVQEDQAAGVDSVVRATGHEVADRVPIVPMRIAAINGREGLRMLRDSAGQTRASWALRREFRSTYRDTVVASETVTSGKWFRRADAGGPLEVSLEAGVARELRVELGDTITWNVQGVRVPTVLTSLRDVKWARFEPNFFAVFPTRALATAPKQFVFLVRAPGRTEVATVQRAVVRRYPSVSMLDLTLVQRTITDVLAKVTTAIRFLALTSLALGIPVLFSAVSATRRARIREAVLLKTLGATRRQIRRIMVAEYAILGAMGALMGVLLSGSATWALDYWVFKVPFVPAISPAAAVALGTVAVALAIGVLTGRDVFAETPMAALREA